MPDRKTPEASRLSSPQPNNPGLAPKEPKTLKSMHLTSRKASTTQALSAQCSCDAPKPQSKTTTAKSAGAQSCKKTSTQIIFNVDTQCRPLCPVPKAPIQKHSHSAQTFNPTRWKHESGWYSIRVALRSAPAGTVLKAWHKT